MHIQHHTGQYSYFCSQCSKGFSVTCSYKEHMREVMKVKAILVITVVKCSKVKKKKKKKKKKGGGGDIISLNTLGYIDLQANIVIKGLTNNQSL